MQCICGESTEELQSLQQVLTSFVGNVLKSGGDVMDLMIKS